MKRIFLYTVCLSSATILGESTFEGLPPGGPSVSRGYDIFFTGDFLLWQANQGNLQYAATGYSLDASSSMSKGTTYYPSLRYDMGFRLGFGITLPYDAWDVYSQYTWFGSFNNKGSVFASQNSGLRPSIDAAIPLPNGSYYTYAKGNFTLRLNVLDIELGRNSFVTKHIAMRPFFGVKGVLKSENNGNEYAGLALTDPFSYNASNRSSLYGVGGRGGLATTWHISSMWSLFANGAVSALWGRFQTKREDTYHIGSELPITPVFNENNEYSVSPVLELYFGIRKEAWFCDRRYHISLQAGWEEQIWWNQGHFSPGSIQTQNNTLTLQGLSATLRIDF